jgi:hypothetical protein
VSGGAPDSTNKSNVLDLVSFIAPPESRRLGTNPGEPAFGSRWDLMPGRGVFTNWINVTDLTPLIAGLSGYPPMLVGAGNWKLETGNWKLAIGAWVADWRGVGGWPGGRLVSRRFISASIRWKVL